MPGEIADLSQAVEKLSGYRRMTITEVKKRLKDGSDQELGLLYYLFSAHHWGLADLRALWEGETGWHDLILAMSSYEANQRMEAAKKKAAGHPDDPAAKKIKLLPRWGAAGIKQGLREPKGQVRRWL